MKTTITTAIFCAVAFLASAQTFTGSRPGAAAVGLVCHCEEETITRFFRMKDSGTTVSCDGTKAVAYSTVNAGHHRFTGFPVASQSEAMKYTHRSGSQRKEGFIYFEQREDPLEFTLATGDVVTFEVVRVNKKKN